VQIDPDVTALASARNHRSAEAAKPTESSLLVTPEIVRPEGYFTDNAQVFEDYGVERTRARSEGAEPRACLRDQGVPDQAYISKTSYFLFLKMVDIEGEDYHRQGFFERFRRVALSLQPG
jgi:hypothetical protein